MKESQSTAKVYAKDLIIDMLSRETIQKEFGFVLQAIFQSQSVVQPTLELIYWSLRQPTTVQDTLYIAKQQINYFFTDSEGLKWTSNSVAVLAAWWLLKPNSRIFTISPLISWTCEQEDKVVKPLTEVVTDLTRQPWAQELSTDSMKWFVEDYLKSEKTKQQVKQDFVRFIEEFTQVFEINEKAVSENDKKKT